MLGETIGNYRVVRLIGSGAMGHVFEARTSVDTRVAIKVLRPEVCSSDEHVQRLFNEARAVHRISHAGAARIFDVGVHRGQAYLVMEFLNGQQLSDRIAQQGRLEGVAVYEIGRQIASVLEAVHASGVIHRDLKPDNIYLVHDQELAHGERVKILDFGIAKVSVRAGPQTIGTMGTPAYMAPEQWGNSADVDARADIYSFGCLMFEIVCGQTPFVPKTMADACAKHLSVTPPRARSIVASVPPRLDDLLARMLAKSPGDRPTIRECAKVFAELRAASSGAIGLTAEPILASESGSLEEAPARSQGFARAPSPVVALPGAVSQSTLGGGEVFPHADSTRSHSMLFVAGGLATGVAALALWVTLRDDAVVPATPRPVDAGVAPKPAAREAPREVTRDPPRRTTLKHQLLERNPFVEIRGVRLQAHQVTNGEYALFVKQRDVTNAAKPDLTKPDQPLAWITYHQALAFCTALDARLPTDAEWEKAAGNEWGIMSGSVMGPLREWTATFNGLATARGGVATMTLTERKQAEANNRYTKKYETAETAGTGILSRAVADETTGFRCAPR